MVTEMMMMMMMMVVMILFSDRLHPLILSGGLQGSVCLFVFLCDDDDEDDDDERRRLA